MTSGYQRTGLLSSQPNQYYLFLFFLPGSAIRNHDLIVTGTVDVHLLVPFALNSDRKSIRDILITKTNSREDCMKKLTTTNRIK